MRFELYQCQKATFPVNHEVLVASGSALVYPTVSGLTEDHSIEHPSRHLAVTAASLQLQ